VRVGRQSDAPALSTHRPSSTPEVRIRGLLVGAGRLLAPGSVDQGATRSNSRPTGRTTGRAHMAGSAPSGRLGCPEKPPGALLLTHRGSHEALGFDTSEGADTGLAPSRGDGPAGRRCRNSRSRRSSTAVARSARGPAFPTLHGAPRTGRRLALCSEQGAHGTPTDASRRPPFRQRQGRPGTRPRTCSLMKAGRARRLEEPGSAARAASACEAQTNRGDRLSRPGPSARVLLA
jgi:hypothetical protein